MKLLAAAGLALVLLFAPTSSFAQKIAPSLGVSPLDVNTCPDTHPIRGNKAGRQASRWYAVTDPEECFATVEDAEAAGDRAPLR